MNVWDWVHEFEYEAHLREDQERVRLAQIHHEAYAYRHAEPDEMLSLLEEGRRLAISLNEPWWVLFFEHWCLETCIYYRDEYRDILDRAVKVTLELRKPQFEQHPLKFCIHCNLVAAYLCVDPVGYEKEIRAALDYLESQVEAEGEGKYLLTARQHWFAFELGDYSSSLEHCQRWLAYTADDSDWHLALHHGVGVHMGLSHIYHRLGDFSKMGEYAFHGEQLAQRRGARFELASFRAWQAIALQAEGKTEDARRRNQQALMMMARLGKHPDDSFFEAVCSFAERVGDLDSAWSQRQTQLDQVDGKGQHSTVADCRIQQVRLRVLRGEDPEEELRLAEEAVRKLRRPDLHLERLSRASRGEQVW